ncbi:MAG TPA: hypothetical protein VNS09_04000 [Solirubrobacter sp.]|nr:hypothetical protein [Solirubrobacter sp.]
MQNAAAATLPRRDAPVPPRPAAERLDGDGARAGASVANPYDKVLDELRAAALRRDAAATRTSDASRSRGAAEDAALQRRERGDGE